MKRNIARTLTCVLLSITIFSQLTALAFTDVQEGHQYYNEITYATEKGYFSGIGNDQFNPDGQLTRAMYVMAMRNVASINGLDVSGSGSVNFSDVDAGSWYEDAVDWALKNKLVSGYEDGTFRPMDIITKEQMAVIMVKFATLMNISLDSKSSLTISDASDISSWARLDVYALTKAHLVSLSDNKYAPKNAVTRALAASVFVNMVDPDRDGLQVLYEGNGLRIVTRGLDTITSSITADLDLYITYSGDDDIILQTRAEKVNGYAGYPIFSPNLSKGDKMFTSLSFNKSMINGGYEIQSIEFYFHVAHQKTLEKLYESEPITLAFDGKYI